MKKFTTVLVWLRNDLRLHDNETLARAARDTQVVVPVYCLDPRHFATTSFGFPKTGAFRAQFLLESLSDTRLHLRNIGADLIIRQGKPEEILPTLAKEYAAQAVYFHEEVTDEELRVEEALLDNLAVQSVKDVSFWGSTLYHLDDLPFSTEKLPDVFTQFRKMVEKSAKVRPTFPAPQALMLPTGIEPGEIPTVQDLGLTPADMDTRAALPFKGGETQA
jgi:deoxyribodipyrimidine photo-lyase